MSVGDRLYEELVEAAKMIWAINFLLAGLVVFTLLLLALWLTIAITRGAFWDILMGVVV